MLVLASLLRLGFVANFISEPVLAGFESGIGLVISVARNATFVVAGVFW
jgi:MFS superfamily sulfate permease-like transporter